MEEKLLHFRNEHRSFPRLPGVAKASLQEARAGCPGAKELSTKALTWAAGVRDSWGRKVVMVLETKCLVEQMNLFSRSPPCPDSLPAARETGALQGTPRARWAREKGGFQQVLLDERQFWMALGTGIWTVISQQFKDPVSAVAKVCSGGSDGRRGLMPLQRGVSTAWAVSSSCLVSPQPWAGQCCSIARLNTERRQESLSRMVKAKERGGKLSPGVFNLNIINLSQVRSWLWYKCPLMAGLSVGVRTGCILLQ